jgi:hypothetical protein
VPHADDFHMSSSGGMAVSPAESFGDDPLLPRLLRFIVFFGAALLCWAPPLLLFYWLVS